MQKLYIISNEKIFTDGEIFFCDNIDLKSTSEGLNKNFEVIKKLEKVKSNLINIRNEL